MNIYNDIFESWKDVQKEYQITDPEPDQVLYATYTYENYSGDSLVIYRNDDKYYLVTAAHCSCNGLENAWIPEEFETRELLFKYLENTRVDDELFIFLLKHCMIC